MERSQFDEYIRRFNAEDSTAFERYLHPQMRMLNGALQFQGVTGMKEHYQQKIWPHFVERITVLRYLSDTSSAAVQMWTNFKARHDAETLFGSVRAGEQFDFRGLVLYEIEAGLFTSICVAYNSFTHTDSSGQIRHLGIPH